MHINVAITVWRSRVLKASMACSSSPMARIAAMSDLLSRLTSGRGTSTTRLAPASKGWIPRRWARSIQAWPANSELRDVPLCKRCPVFWKAVGDGGEENFSTLPRRSASGITLQCGFVKTHRVGGVSSARLVAIVGPTATGKSDLALDVAEACGGEIINADAMQLYRGMDIGTAKLPLAERRGIPHHLIDVLDVTEPASVAAYQRQARAAAEELLARDTVPVLVGGSGLYVQAVLDDLEFPGTEPEVRARWEDELRQHGPEALHARLAQTDPRAAEAILPTNGRRLVRALEVMEITGKPFSANLPVIGEPRYGALLIGLDRPVADLDGRVDSRVARMFDLGLTEEVRRLEAAGLRSGRTASRALGYQQVLAELDAGGDMAAAAAETAKLTRRFVRRQRSWFRRDKRIRWFDGASEDLSAQVSSLLDTYS